MFRGKRSRLFRFKRATTRRFWSDFSIDQAGENSLEHRALGRTGDPEGWIPVENIIQAWREKTTVDYFDVEFMGTRPSAEGTYVFNQKTYREALDLLKSLAPQNVYWYVDETVHRRR